MQSLCDWLQRFRRSETNIPSKKQNEENDNNEKPYEPTIEDYPVFPPPPPHTILANPEKYWAIVSARKYGAPRGVFEQSSIYPFYMLYEYIVLDKVFPYRNMLEWFWKQHQWSVKEVPDPQDEDPTRYAFLACVTYLMVRSYNARVALGLSRTARAIMTSEEIEEARNRLESERTYEEVPTWAKKVPALPETLSIPTHEGVSLEKGDERADPDFLAKNILFWTPHIHFT